MATSAPASANAVAVHLPIPLAAPVTKPFPDASSLQYPSYLLVKKLFNFV